MSVAAYIRVSSPKGQKTDSQRAELEAWVKRQRLKDVQWLEDRETGKGWLGAGCRTVALV